MLTKTNNIRNKSKKKKKNQKKKKKIYMGIRPRGSHNYNFKEIHVITSEIINATDGRWPDDGQLSHIISSGDSVKQR